jgi:hypothetical protein
VTSHAQNDEPRTISRRRIVRSGATLAWAVPAITVATSVPAFAGSECCDISFSGSATWADGELNYIDIPLTISNGCSGAVTGLTVTLTICGVDKIVYSGSEYLPAGWVQGAKANQTLTPDSNGCYTVTYTYAATLGGNATVNPTFRLKSKAYIGSGNRPSGSITAHVAAGACTAAQDVSIVLPAVG